MRRIAYRLDCYPFAEWLCSLFQVRSLEELSSYRPDRVVTRETEHGDVHRAFYKAIEDERSAFWNIYWSFVKRVIIHALPMNIQYYVQRVPNLRVQFPHNLAVGQWHRDADYGHQAEEINFWVPLTPTVETNTIWIDRAPVLVQLGEVLQFDGATREHGNVINESERTRVSLDFRLLPVAWYRAGGETINGIMKFRVGEYWVAV
jgi:hypothetical protein